MFERMKEKYHPLVGERMERLGEYERVGILGGKNPEFHLLTFG